VAQDDANGRRASRAIRDCTGTFGVAADGPRVWQAADHRSADHGAGWGSPGTSAGWVAPGSGGRPTESRGTAARRCGWGDAVAEGDKELGSRDPCIRVSSAVATPSRSSLKRPAYTSRVIAAEAWPSIRWTALTLAPGLIARLAAVCRRSWGVMSSRPIAVRAGSKTRRRDLGGRPRIASPPRHR